MTVEERNALVIKYLFLAEKIAKNWKRKLSHISFDELNSAACLGLVQAASRYKKEKNDSFESYAVMRIIGAIRDYLRELSWGSRANPIKKVESFVLEEYLFKIDSFNNSDFFDNFIKNLPLIHKVVLRYYFKDHMKIQEIASVLNVHQSRVSQILSESKLKLRDYWKDQEFEIWSAVA